MVAPYLIDHDPDELDADAPLSSQVALELIRGNMLRLHEQQLFDVTGLGTQGDMDIPHYFSSTNVWEHFSRFCVLPVPVRVQLAGGPRPIVLSIEGKVTQAAATVKLQIYVLPTWTPDPSFSEVDGLDGPYAEFSFSTSSFVRSSDTVTPEAIGVAPLPINGPMGPAGRVRVVYLQAFVQATDLTAVPKFRGLRIREAPES